MYLNKSVEKRTFLVDTEDIKDFSFVRIVNLTENDTVCFFKSSKSKSIDLDNMELLVKSRCKVEYVSAGVSEYRLVSSYISFYLGNIIEKSDSKLFVVSNDKLLDNLFALIREKGKVVLIDSDKLLDIENGISDYCEDECEEVEVLNFASFNKSHKVDNEELIAIEKEINENVKSIDVNLDSDLSVGSVLTESTTVNSILLN